MPPPELDLGDPLKAQRLAGPVPAGTLIINPTDGRILTVTKATQFLPEGFSLVNPKRPIELLRDVPKEISPLIAQGRVLADIINVPTGSFLPEVKDGEAALRPSLAGNPGVNAPFYAREPRRAFEEEVRKRLRTLLGTEPDDASVAATLMASGNAPLPPDEMSLPAIQLLKGSAAEAAPRDSLRTVFNVLSSEKSAELTAALEPEPRSRLEFLGHEFSAFLPDVGAIGKDVNNALNNLTRIFSFAPIEIEGGEAVFRKPEINPLKILQDITFGAGLTVKELAEAGIKSLEPFITFEQGVSSVAIAGLRETSTKQLEHSFLGELGRRIDEALEKEEKASLHERPLLRSAIGAAITLAIPYIGAPGIYSFLGRGARRGAAALSPTLRLQYAREGGAFDFPAFSRLFKQGPTKTIPGAGGKPREAATYILDVGKTEEFVSSPTRARYLDDLRVRGKLTDAQIAEKSGLIDDVQMVLEFQRRVKRPLVTVVRPDRFIPTLASELRTNAKATEEIFKAVANGEVLAVTEQRLVAAIKPLSRRAKAAAKVLGPGGRVTNLQVADEGSLRGVVASVGKELNELLVATQASIPTLERRIRTINLGLRKLGRVGEAGGPVGRQTSALQVKMAEATKKLEEAHTVIRRLSDPEELGSVMAGAINKRGLGAVNPATGEAIGRITALKVGLVKGRSGRLAIDNVILLQRTGPLVLKDISNIRVGKAEQIVAGKALGRLGEMGKQSVTFLKKSREQAKATLADLQAELRGLPEGGQITTTSKQGGKLVEVIKDSPARQALLEQIGDVERLQEELRAALPQAELQLQKAQLKQTRLDRANNTKHLDQLRSERAKNIGRIEALIDPARFKGRVTSDAFDVLVGAEPSTLANTAFRQAQTGQILQLSAAVKKARGLATPRAILKLFGQIGTPEEKASSIARLFMPEYIKTIGPVPEAQTPLVQKIFAQSGLRFDQKEALAALMTQTTVPEINELAKGLNKSPVARWLNAWLRGSVPLFTRGPTPFGRATIVSQDMFLGGAGFNVTSTMRALNVGMAELARDVGILGRGRNAVSNMFRSVARRNVFDGLVAKRVKSGTLRRTEALTSEDWDEIFAVYAGHPFLAALDLSSKSIWGFARQLPNGRRLSQEQAGLLRRGLDDMLDSFVDLEAQMTLQGQSVSAERVFEQLIKPSMRDQSIARTTRRVVAERAGEEVEHFVADAPNPLQILVNVRNFLNDLSTNESVLRGLGMGRRLEAFTGAKRIPLSAAVVDWDKAASGTLMGMHRRLINKRILQNIYDDVLRPAGVSEPFTRIFKVSGSRIEVSGKNLIPDKLRPDIDYIADVLGGTTPSALPAKIATGVARALGQGLLLADMGLLGIQLPMFLALNPAKAMDWIVNAIRLTDDRNFTAFLMNDFDEIELYVSKGLRVGTEAFLGGEFGEAWWAEHLPIVGRLATGISAVNDIQFSRWMLYMKVEAMRHHLHVYQMVNSSADFANFVRKTKPDGIRQVERILGGEYTAFTREEVIEAVSRLVNNQLGGLARFQTGTRLWEESLQRMLLLVPGFFRARVGLIGQVLEQGARGRPTLEGMAAASIMAREFLFAGSVGAMTTLVSGGDLSKFQWKDPRRFDWLAAQLPGGDIITTLPVAGTTRALFQMFGGIGDIDSLPEEVSERLRSVNRLLEGRLSPPASAVYFTLKGEDFLGRKRRGTYDRVVGTAVDTLAPIFVQSAMEGLGATGGLGFRDRADLLKQLPVEFVGRSFIPQRAGDELDALAEEFYGEGSKWFNIGEAGQDIIRSAKQDEVVALEERFEQESAQFMSDSELLESQQFELLESKRDRRWNNPTQEDAINGVVASSQQVLNAVTSGQMSGSDGREHIFELKARDAADFQLTDELLAARGLKSLDQRREERLKRYKAGEIDLTLIALAELELNSLEVPLKQVNVPGVGEVGYLDFESRRQEEEAIKKRYPAGIIAQIEAQRIERANPGEREVEAASEEYGFLVENLSPYRNTTPDDGRRIDEYRGILRNAVSAVRLQGNEETPARAIRVAALKYMASHGQIKTRRDADLAIMAFSVETSDQDALAARNPDYLVYILQHPGMVLWYDFLARDIPTPLRRFLPSQVLQGLQRAITELALPEEAEKVLR